MRVAYSCPRCGAPVELDETDRIFSCGFCRVRLCLCAGDFFRYHMLPGNAVTGPDEEGGEGKRERIFVPYWRFRGMRFTCVGQEVKGRMIDASFRATDHDFLPESLGVRPQAIRLRPVSPALAGAFLPPTYPFREVDKRISGTAGSIDRWLGEEPAAFTSFVGEIVSMVYLPLTAGSGALVDAVAGRPIGRYGVERQASFGSAAPRISWEMGFLPALCPVCGWDLEGGAESVTLVCRGCDTAWAPDGGRLEKIPFGSLGWEGGTDPVHLPFWRLECRVSGMEMSTREDLIRLTNLPPASIGKGVDEKIHFWVPAFRVAPRPFLRLARQMTIVQSPDIPDTRLPRGPLAAVTLPAGEASEAVMSLLAELAMAKRVFFPKLASLSIAMWNKLLVYVPFNRRGGELVQTRLNFGIATTSFLGHEGAGRTMVNPGGRTRRA